MKVVVGAWNLTSTTENTQDIKIDRVFIHPGYTSGNLTHSGKSDIALIKLKRNINFNGT